MKQTIFCEQRTILTDHPYPKSIQEIPCAGGFTELHCGFVEISHTVFPSDLKFEHPFPLISRLFLVGRGHVNILMDGVEHHLVPGKLYFLPANHSFIVEYLDRCITKGYHLHLSDSMSFPVAEKLPGLVTLDNEALYRTLYDASEALDNNFCFSLVMAAVTKCLIPVLTDLRSRESVPLRFRTMLEKLSADPPASWRLEHFEKTMNMSVAALSKGFYRAFGVTWKNYRAEQILFQARAMLQRDDFTATEIADALGFDDVNYFYTFFRRKTGCTPEIYRKKIRDIDSGL